MKNRIYKGIAIIGIFFGMALAGVQAQTPGRVEVKIPFEFSAGKETLKPGVYRIRCLSGNLLSISNTDGKALVILNAPVTSDVGNKQAGERLVFNNDGDRYLLAQVWLSVDSGRQVMMESQAKKSERVEIALRRR